GCSFTRTQVHDSNTGTNITIGTDSPVKPFSCGELIYKQDKLSYGTYSIDMIASNVVGQVTSFFLIANGDTEIDIELTGLNNRLGWMNIWHDNHQNPVSIHLPFNSSLDWHSYSFDWYNDHIVWSIDGNVVLNRSDIATTSPDKANYKLAINSWTQVQPEDNITWAGTFAYPTDGRVPQAQFRNMKYVPRVYGPNGSTTSGNNGAATNTNNANTDTTNNNSSSDNGTTVTTATTTTTTTTTTIATTTAQSPTSPPAVSSAELLKSTNNVFAIAGSAMAAVAFTFTVLF
ncbi:glycosyl hydrolases family 16-domain-containing protein, partial [Dissophora ornata]